MPNPWLMLIAAFAVASVLAGTYMKGRSDGTAICENKYLEAALESAGEALEEQARQTNVGLDAATESAQVKEIIKWRTKEIEIPVREGCELDPDGIRLRKSIIDDAADRLSGNNPASDPD